MNQSPPQILAQQVVWQDKCQQPSRQKKGAHSNHDDNDKTISFGNTSKQVVEKVCLETGLVLASFRSVTEATQSVFGGLFPAICAVIKGTKTSHMGFGWRRAFVAVQVPAAASSTRPVASTEQDDRTTTATPMTTKCLPKTIKVTVRNGETNDDFANHLLAEFPQGDLSLSILFPAKDALPPCVTADCGSDLIEQDGTITDFTIVEEVSVEEKESVFAVEGESNATDNKNSVYKTTSNLIRPSSAAFSAGVSGFALKHDDHSSNKENTTSRFANDSRELTLKHLSDSGSEFEWKEEDAYLFEEGEDNGDFLDDDSPPFDKGESISRIADGRHLSKIEQVCQQTGKIVRCFDSVKEAVEITGFSFDYIRQSIGKVTDGFLWRIEESNKSPKRPSIDPKKKIIEKFCMKTGKVLEKFESCTEVAQSMGYTPIAISIALREGVFTCQGYGWRHTDSTASSPASTRSASSVLAISPGTSSKKPVEKYCLQTGKVVKTFGSVAEAAQSVGVSPARMRIAAIRYDGIKSCAGFGWRFADSKKEAPTAAYKKRHLPDDAAATRNGYSQKRIRIVVGGETYDEFSNLLAEFCVVSAPRKNASNSMQEDTYADSSSEVACDSGRENEFEMPSDDHLPDESSDDDSISEGERENEFDLPSGDETLDESSDDDSVFTVEGESNTSLNQDECPESSSNPPNIDGVTGTKIEQVCLLTGKVMGCYDTLKEASTVTGISKKSLQGFVDSVAHGVLWRRVEIFRKSSKRCRINKNENRAVEQLCLKTGEVLGYFGSATEAAESMGALKGAILRALDKDSDIKTCAGFGWRYLGSTAPPDAVPRSAVISVSAGAGKSRDSHNKKQDHQTSKANITSLPYHTSKPVQKICRKTGQVLEDFRSTKEAAASVGVSRSGISYVLLGYDGRTSCAGFGWRYTDSRTRSAVISVSADGAKSRGSHNKEQDHKTSKENVTSLSCGCRPVEKVCMTTGQVLGDFGSVKEAAASVGVTRPCISNALNGRSISSAGFVWRYTNFRTVSRTTKPEPTGSQPSTVSSKPSLKKQVPTKTHKHIRAPFDLSSGNEVLDESSSDVDSVFAVEGESTTHKHVRPSASQPPTSRNSGGRSGTKIEQVCLQTGKGLQRFDSIAEAARLTGLVFSHHRMGMGRVSNGFFCRVEGSTALPSHLKEPNPSNVSLDITQKPLHTSHLVETSTQHFTSSPSVVLPPRVSARAGKPVEKYCVKTGRVLARFGSITEAALSVGVAPANIMAVVSSFKTSKMCMGFGWRHAASAEPPLEASDDPVPAVSTNAVGVPSHVDGVASVGTYFPQQGDRFRIYYDKVSVV
jgi:hypothetical protein